MTQSRHAVGSIAVAAGSAGVGGIAAGGAGGSSHDGFIAVTQSIALGCATFLTGLGGNAVRIRPIMSDHGIRFRIGVFISIGAVGAAAGLVLVNCRATENRCFVGTDGLAEGLAQQISNLAGGELISIHAGGFALQIRGGAASGALTNTKLNLAAFVHGAAGQIVVIRHCSGIILITCHTANADRTGNIAGVVTVSQRAGIVITNHAANIGAAANRAGIIAVAHGAVGMITHYAAHVTAFIANDAGIVAAADRAGVIIAHHAADIVAVAADRAGIVAVGHRAIVASANHAADIAAIAIDAAGVEAIAHSAVAFITNHSAYIGVALEVGAHNAHFFNCAIVAKIAHKANIADGCIIEIQAGNGFAVAVEGAGIGHAAATNGCPCAIVTLIQFAISIQDIGVNHDIVHQLAVDGCFAAVDQLGKPVQLTGIIDFVNIAIEDCALVEIAALTETVYIAVTQSFLTSYAANGARADIGAGRGSPAVTQRRNFVANLDFPTLRTSVGGVATLGTGRISHDAFIAVTQSLALGGLTDRAGLGGGTIRIHPSVPQRRHFVGNVGIAALRAGVGGITGGGASGSRYYTLVAMTQSLALGSATNRAGLGSGAIRIHPSMTQRRHLVRNVGVAALGTGVGGVTILGTGGCRHDAFVAVTQSLALGGVTDRASLGGGAVRIHPSVTQRRDFVCYVAVAAGAGVGGVTTSRTGRCGHNSHMAVTQSLTLGGVTDRAILCGGAGCIDPSMTRCHNLVVNIGIATDGTCVGGVTILSTGGSGHNSFIIVTRNLSINGVTDRAILGGRTGSIDPSMTQRRALGCAANGAGLSDSTSRVIPAVLTALTANGAGAVFPNVIAVLALDVAVQGLGFYLTGVAGSNGSVTPVGIIRPALVGEEFIVGGGFLCVDRRIPVPVTVRTSATIRSLITIIRRVIVAIRERTGVERMEIAISRGIIGFRVYAVAGAPVIPQVTRHRIGVDYGFCRSRFRSSHLAAGFIIGAVQAVRGGESGRPRWYVTDRLGTGLNPLTALDCPARHRRIIGGGGFIIGVTVLGLGFDQFLRHTLRLGGLPFRNHAGVVFIIRIAAIRTGIADLLIIHTSTRNGFRNIIMAGAGGDFPVAAVTDGTGINRNTVTCAAAFLHDLRGIAVIQTGNGQLVHIATLGAGVNRLSLSGTGRRMERGGGIAVGTAGLGHAGAEHIEALFRKYCCSGGGCYRITVGIVALVISGNGIGKLAGGQIIESRIVIDVAAAQGIGIISGRITCADHRIAGNAEAAVNIHSHGGKSIIFSADIALNEEVVALDNTGRNRGVFDCDILRQSLHKCGVGGSDIACGAVRSNDLVPQLTVGILEQAHGDAHIASAQSRLFHRSGIHCTGAGLAHKRGVCADLDLAVGCVFRAAVHIAGRLLRAGRNTGERTKFVTNGGEFGIRHRVVGIPVPHLGDVGPHTVTQAVILAGTTVVATIPDLCFRADAGVVAPNQEVRTTQIGSRNVFYILAVIAVLTDIRRVPFVPDAFLSCMIEGPLAVVHTSGIGAAAGFSQSIVCIGLDTVIQGSALRHIVAHRLRVIAGGTGVGVEGRIPILDLNIVRKFIVSATVRGATQEIVVHTHGIALVIQKGIQFVDVGDELREAPCVAVTGSDIAGAQLNLVSANTHVSTAGILLEEVCNINVQLENERLAQIVSNIDRRVVGPLQSGRPARGIGIVDDTVHIGSIIGLLIISGIEGIAGVRIVMLLERPSHVVQMRGAVKAGNDFDVVLLGHTQNLNDLSSGQIFTLIRIILISRQCPGSIVASANPAKVIGRLELSGVEALVPQVETEAGVVREMELQRIIAHPRHFPDEVADPILRIVLSAAVQADRTLYRVRRVRSGKAGDGIAVGITEMLQQHVGAVQKAVHIAVIDKSRSGDFQSVALGGDGRILLDDHVTGGYAAFRAPSDFHSGAGGSAVSSKMPLHQLDCLQQVTLRCRVRHNVNAAGAGQCKGAAVGTEAVNQLAQRRRTGRRKNRDGRQHAEHHSQQQNECHNTFRSDLHNKLPSSRK